MICSLVKSFTNRISYLLLFLYFIPFPHSPKNVILSFGFLINIPRIFDSSSIWRVMRARMPLSYYSKLKTAFFASGSRPPSSTGLQSRSIIEPVSVSFPSMFMLMETFVADEHDKTMRFYTFQRDPHKPHKSSAISTMSGY